MSSLQGEDSARGLKVESSASLQQAAGTCDEHCRLDVFPTEAANCILTRGSPALPFVSCSTWRTGSAPAWNSYQALMPTLQENSLSLVAWGEPHVLELL